MIVANANILILAGALSGLAAIAHLGIIIGGPDWYRFFGAGEGMARLAADGSWRPGLITLAIAVILGLWSAYALSGAGVLPRLPFLKPVLITITSVYLLRGIAGFVLSAIAPGGNSPAFWVWSSVICLLVGLVHAIGVRGVWSSLSGGHT